MSSEKKRSGFSMWWVLLSFVTFILVELLLGGFIGQMLIGKYISISLKLTIQSLLHLSSFFIGGVIIGILSPGIRTWEPAIAAFLSVGIMFSISMFTPYSYIAFSQEKMLIGGCIAFFLSMMGARLGERVFGNRV